MTINRGHMSHYRHALVLAVAWRLLTELFRRHSAKHDLRLLRTHPGNSHFGQLRLLLNPTVGYVQTCLQLVLNLGGPTGTYVVLVNGNETARGDFLAPGLAGQLPTLLNEVEAAMMLRAPISLPTSTPPVLSMRVVAEILTSVWLDRQDYGLETAWFDWSGGPRVQPWASHFGVDVVRLQADLDSGKVEWEEVFLQLTDLFRLGVTKDGALCDPSLVVDMRAGVITSLNGDRPGEPFYLTQCYEEHDRRLEPLVAELLVTMRC